MLGPWGGWFFSFFLYGIQAPDTEVVAAWGLMGVNMPLPLSEIDQVFGFKFRLCSLLLIMIMGSYKCTCFSDRRKHHQWARYGYEHPEFENITSKKTKHIMHRYKKKQ